MKSYQAMAVEEKKKDLVASSYTILIENLHELSKDNLKSLHKRIIEVWNAKERDEDIQASMTFRVGQLVEFWDKHGFKHEAVIERVNVRTASVKDTKDQRRWKVAFTYLKKLQLKIKDELIDN